MKILFYCQNFYPKTGGLEHIAQYLATDLHKHGLEIKLITYTPLDKNIELNHGFEIIRNPNFLHLLKCYFWCDIFFHHNVSLKGLLPIIIYPSKKWVVLHHLTYFNNQSITFIEQIKRQLSRFSFNISCSKFVNSTLPKPGIVIGNTYEDGYFFSREDKKKENSILFVGRLVSDKGCDLLINAFYSLLNNYNPKNIHLTIVGDGPEMGKLKKLVDYLDLKNKVTFLGTLKGEYLAIEMSKHQIMVIPSIWEEPFGIVALEGIASDCVPIYARAGGLPEACGNIGIGFTKGDVLDLEKQLIYLMSNYEYYYQQMLNLKTNHLNNFKRKVVMRKFITYLNECVKN